MNPGPLFNRLNRPPVDEPRLCRTCGVMHLATDNSLCDHYDPVGAPWDGFVLTDALVALAALPDACIDLTVTDPAYESLERHRSKGTTTRLSQSKGSSNEWFGTVSNERMAGWFGELYRVHKPLTHAYIMCDEPTAEVYKRLARDAGWWVWKSLIWVKTKANGEPKMGMGYHWRNATERVLFLEKRDRPQVAHADWTVRHDPTGKGRRLNNLGVADVLMVESVRNGYPTEKPHDLIIELIANSSDEGERVFDPFSGSGVVASVARACGRQYTVSDISPKAETAYNALMGTGARP